MKKLAMALVCLVSVVFFASCDPEPVVENPQPSITVMTGEGFITGTIDEPTVINTEDDTTYYQFGFSVASNAETNKELSSLKLTYVMTYADTTETIDTIIDLTGLTKYEYVESLLDDEEERMIVLEAVITAVVTDVDNQTATASIAMNFDKPATPLITMPITWLRRGSTVEETTEEQMASVGLKWYDNHKEVFVTIVPLNSKMYLCPGEDFADIATDFEMYEYYISLIEQQEPIEEYRNITANNSADYDDMLVVITEDSEIYLVHFTHANVQKVYNGDTYVRTDITISGEVK